MKTNILNFKRVPKTMLLVLLMSVVRVTNMYAQTDNPYMFYLLYSDYQVCEQKILHQGESAANTIQCQQLPPDEFRITYEYFDRNGGERRNGYLTMAQNEKEGFQVFFREQEKTRNLRIEVSPFKNSQNEVIQHSLYWEDFFTAINNAKGAPGAPDALSEALIPYTGEIQTTTIGHNKVFYVELKSTKNQTPGEYTSTIKVFDGDEEFDEKTITIRVWNFALPETHYSEVVMGIYDCNSSYNANRSIFTLNGIAADEGGNVSEADLPMAKRILDGYQECLLDHGVSPYELPRWIMNDDPKAAELAMADLRRKVFSIPVNHSHYNTNNGNFSSDAIATINQYKDIVYNNPFLKDKAFFYPRDERALNEGNLLTAMMERLQELWPGCHAVSPFDTDYSQTTAILNGKTDILCPNQDLFNPYKQNYDVKQSNYLDFIDRDNHPNRFRTWRYQGDALCGGTYFWISPLSTVGVMRRVPFWQQYLMNSDGWLHWNCAYLPDNWEKNTLPASSGIQTGNGDGVLLYPGTMFGQSAETPIVSLRLKQLSQGIDDYDYLRLAKEFLDEDDLKTAISSFFYSWNLDNCNVLNKETGFVAYSCMYLQKARYMIAKLLNDANTEHEWGEWQVAVLPDETHHGLIIRTCANCGAQEGEHINEWTFSVGDINHDGVVNVSDVVALVNIILNKENTVIPDEADVNGDNEINISDVVALVNYILNK